MHTFSRFARPYQRSCAASSTILVGNQIAEYSRSRLSVAGRQNTRRLFRSVRLSVSYSAAACDGAGVGAESRVPEMAARKSEILSSHYADSVASGLGGIERAVA